MPKPPPKLYRLLILEDDLEVGGLLLLALHKMEPLLAPYDLDVTLLSTSDAVVLDRDCKMNASFHILDLQHFNPKNIISISSTPMWNHEAIAKGIEHAVPKSFGGLSGFAKQAADKVHELLR